MFILPLHQGYNKNIWENCAKILASKSDETLEPYLEHLLEWVEDITWPGALIIVERLKKFSNLEEFYLAYENTIKRASVTNRGMWIVNLSEFIEENEELKNMLPENLRRMVEFTKYYYSNYDE